MSHNIRYFDLHCSASKRKFQKSIDNFVAHEDYYEGAAGLPSPIRWIDKVCNHQEEAYEYIQAHDRGWYDSLAVQYKVGRKKYWLIKIEYHT